MFHQEAEHTPGSEVREAEAEGPAGAEGATSLSLIPMPVR